MKLPPKILGLDSDLLWGTTHLALLVAAAIVMTLAGCELYDALVGTGESGEEAAQAVKEAAEQATDTLHALEHVLLMIPVYLAGELRRPLWGKVKGFRAKRRAKRKAG